MEFVAVLRTMLLEGRFCLWAQFADFTNRIWFAVAQNMYCERRQSVITFGLGWSLSDCIALAGCAFVVLVLVHFAVVQCTRVTGIVYVNAMPELLIIWSW